MCTNAAYFDSGMFHVRVPRELPTLSSPEYERFCKSAAARTTPLTFHACRCKSIDVGLARKSERNIDSLNFAFVRGVLQRKHLPRFVYTDDENAFRTALTAPDGVRNLVSRVLAISRFGRLQEERAERLIATLKNRCEEQFAQGSGIEASSDILLLHVLDRPWLRRWIKSVAPPLGKTLCFTQKDVLVGLYIIHRSLLSFRQQFAERLVRSPLLNDIRTKGPFVPRWGMFLYGAWIQSAPKFLTEIHRGPCCKLN